MNYCGIDIASKASAMCVMDEHGVISCEAKLPTDEDGFRTRLGSREAMKCVVEASPLAEWAVRTLEGLGHEGVIIDARRAKAVVCTKKKTDRVNAQDLANMARTSWYTAVHRKSEAARELRTWLTARAGLVETVMGQDNTSLYQAPSKPRLDRTPALRKISLPLRQRPDGV